MKRVLAGYLLTVLAISSVGCCYQGMHCNPQTGMMYGGGLSPCCGGPLDPWCGSQCGASPCGSSPCQVNSGMGDSDCCVGGGNYSPAAVLPSFQPTFRSVPSASCVTPTFDGAVLPPNYVSPPAGCAVPTVPAVPSQPLTTPSKSPSYEPSDTVIAPAPPAAQVTRSSAEIIVPQPMSQSILMQEVGGAQWIRAF